MLTGLKIHATRDGFKLADAREDYSSGDLLADIVQATYPGTSTRKWALRDRTTGKILQPHLTLKENEVESDHDLYLVLKAGATQDVELDISAPDGKNLQCEIPSSIKASTFLAKLVQHFDLAEVDSSGKPVRWILAYESDQEALDPGLSLIDNGIAFKDRLSIRPFSDPNIVVEGISPDGKSERRTFKPDHLLREILPEFLNHFDLQHQTAAGAPTDWQIRNRRTGLRLNLAETLTENEVASGDQLVLEQAEEPRLSLTVQAPDGESRTFEVPEGKATNELLSDVLESFGLAKLNKRGSPQHWSFVDRATETLLDPGKSLSANLVKSGAQLSVTLDDPEQSDLKLKVVSPTKEIRVAEEPGDTAAETILRDLIVAFRLQKRDANGKLNRWVLCRQDSGKPLDMKKSLTDNGLVDGDVLLIRQETLVLEVEEKLHGLTPETAAAKFPEWVKKNRTLLTISGLALLGVAAVFLLIHLLVQPTPTLVQVHVLPNSSTLSAGETLRLRSEVTGGKSGKLIWSLAPEVGSLSPDQVYSAPPSIAAQQSVRVTATSVDDSTKSDTATLTLLPPAAPAAPPVVLAPAEVNLKPAETVQFQASLRADVGSTVQWTLDPDLGTITQAGLYTAPTYLASPQTVMVTASNLSSPQSLAKATISLASSPASRIAPSSVTLIASQSSQFRLAPRADGAVVWQLHPSIGSISATGLYTAPSLVPQGVRLTVTATLAALAPAGTPLAAATINLQPVAIGAITYTSTPGHQYVFRAPVMNAVNSTVLWSIEPKLGNISPEGIYTAPAELPSSRTIAVSATSLADPTKSTKVDLVLPPNRPELTVRINAHRPVLLGGQSEQLVATVTGSNNRGVTWASSGLGNISPLGVYTAPLIIPPQGATVRIIATSNADPSRSAREEIALRPAPGYSGAQAGTVTWSGKIGKNQILTISNESASFGSINGAFPGVPITVELTSKGSRIVTPPSQGNGWKTIVIESQSNQKSITMEWRVTIH